MSESYNQLLKSRIKCLKHADVQGKCVLYVMSRDQRVNDNHALLAAQKHALSKRLPMAVVFTLLPQVKGRSREHYTFMLQGLHEVEKNLKSKNIPIMMLIGDPRQTILAMMHHTQPDAIYFDNNPLRGPRSLQSFVANHAQCSVFVVDTHNVVPVWVASDKKEFGAYTLRPKLHKHFAAYLHEPDTVIPHPHTWPGTVQTLSQLKNAINKVVQDQPPNGTQIHFISGESAAKNHLHNFIHTKLQTYAVDRNNPSIKGQSDLSPYLHFGQISTLRVALTLREVAINNNGKLHFLNSSKIPQPDKARTKILNSIDSLIEEMIVRKELADNYCYYEPNYDSIEAAPKWAALSLQAHRADIREYVYSYDDLVSAKTHDDAWNAAQAQLLQTGKMHGYMRMYWAKKVLEWTESPEQAIDYLIRINDFYSIDGGDPNGYAGILWSVAGVHDRPWFDRPVYGVIRYMNYEGLKRKFDISTYTKQYLSV